MIPKSTLITLRNTYRDGLLHNTIPFWFPRAIDKECGGFLTCFSQDGTLLQSDKSVWFQGRFTWMLATLYNTVARNEEWLSYAKHGVDFLNNHCFDTDGRMFFTLTREGNPSVNAVTSFPRSSLSSRWPPMARRPGTTATYNRP